MDFKNRTELALQRHGLLELLFFIEKELSRYDIHVTLEQEG